jgi:hypothetical protein
MVNLIDDHDHIGNGNGDGDGDGDVGDLVLRSKGLTFMVMMVIMHNMVDMMLCVVYFVLYSFEAWASSGSGLHRQHDARRKASARRQLCVSCIRDHGLHRPQLCKI